ncbi:MAG TPA: NAD(P)/FAD-dependent oxidoreductase [Deltaproteobacteria bacterium]|jgi:phytoene dehydrogenase-like protein|nr:NAD(P)/FAD-dependent oxidoreductase [Deltaproteobacteria bacterium]
MVGHGGYDSLVVGAGPNGLAAAITLARAGRSVCVVDARRNPGGCAGSDEGTLPGYLHDTFSAVFPMAVDTPFFSGLSPEEFPVEWIVPPAALAHPFDDGSCLLLSRSIDSSIQAFGEDADPYAQCIRPFAEAWKELSAEILSPPFHVPRHPLLLMRFGLKGMWPVSVTARRLFRTDKVRALFAGLGAHSIMPLDHPLTSSFALFMCASAHQTGWPIARGGAGTIGSALAAHLKNLGAEILLSHPVNSMKDIPGSRSVFFDLTPGQILAVARERIPTGVSRQLARYRSGPGAFKVDWALDAPIPWRAGECCRASVVHLGGSYEEIARSERLAAEGSDPDVPFVILAQPSLFDPSRAPQGKHTAWAYCHVANGSKRDLTSRIEGQIERFAPGFKKRILSRRVLPPTVLQGLNANLIGGDIAGGANTFCQIFFRPIRSLNPYALSRDGLYICSSSSPPGGGVHGMCGFNAARKALDGGMSHRKP